MSARDRGRGGTYPRKDGDQTPKGEASEADISKISKLLRRQDGSKNISGGSSSDSDSKSSRYKTPTRKRQNDDKVSNAPKKERIKKPDLTNDEDGDDAHRQSVALVNLDQANAAIKELKRKLSATNKKNEGTLKQKTVQIALDLEKKNKNLATELKVVREQYATELQVAKEKFGSANENPLKLKKMEEDIARLGKERKEKDKECTRAKDTLRRIRKERGEAENKHEKVKKELETIIKEVRKLRKVPTRSNIEDGDIEKESLKEDIEEFQKKVKSLEEEISTLKDKSKTSEGENGVRKELDDYKEELANVSKNAEKESDLRAVERNAFEKDIATLKEQKQNAHKKVEEVTDLRSKDQEAFVKEIASLKMRINAATKKTETILASKDERIDELDKEVEHLKGKQIKKDGAAGLDVATELPEEHKKTDSEDKTEGKPKDSNMETMIVTETDKETNIDDIETDDELDSFVGQFKVGDYRIRNVKSAKTSMAKSTKIPKKLTETCKLFTPTTLNNKIMFIAMNARSKTKHSEKPGFLIEGGDGGGDTALFNLLFMASV